MRSIVKNITSYGNVLGWSGTNMRYVTITKSKFYNNGTGVVPNALDSEKYTPPEDNVITDNDIFWNNFNYYAGAPFKVGKAATDSTPYPVGVGVLLFGGRRNRIENNRIYGNWLAGAGMIQQFLLSKKPDAPDLVGNSIANNQFGLNGTDLNGRDLAYDGNGSDNCIAGNTGVAVDGPGGQLDVRRRARSRAPTRSPARCRSELINWAVDGDARGVPASSTTHAPRRASSRCSTTATTRGPRLRDRSQDHSWRWRGSRRSPRPRAALARRRHARARPARSRVNDNYYGPSKLTVHVGDTVDWHWRERRRPTSTT